MLFAFRGVKRIVTRLVETLSHAVDPTETERFVERFGIGDAFPPSLFVKADLQCIDSIVVLLQPLAKLLPRTEKLWLDRRVFHRVGAFRQPCWSEIRIGQPANRRHQRVERSRHERKSILLMSSLAR